jgi:hypothetical protein
VDVDARRFSSAIEETSIRVNQKVEVDEARHRILDEGTFIIRLDRLTQQHLSIEMPINSLVDEVCELARNLVGDVS